MERTPYNDLSQHDKELLAKIEKIDNQMSFYGWPEIASLAEQLEDEYQRELWNDTCKHYNHMIEQKARAYDEALEKARKRVTIEPQDHTDVILKDIFPELKESKDEKIRNQIINFIEEYGNPIHCEWQKDWIAWLEKQGEQKPSMEGTFVNVDEVREDFMQKVYRVLDADTTNDRANQIIDAFDNLPTIAIQKPAELSQSEVTKTSDQVWSEEDEKILKDILVDVKFEGYNNDMLANSYKKINWLKSLKDRVQPKQKLNEHDNYVINKVLDWATFVNPTSSIFEKLPKKQFIESLKSLKQRIGG